MQCPERNRKLDEFERALVPELGNSFPFAEKMTIKTEQRGKVAPDADLVSDRALLRIRDIIYRVSGIHMPGEKMYLLSTRCARRMTAVGARTPREYLDFLTVRPNRDEEMRNLLNEVTIGETCLFRNMAQIDALRHVVLRQIAAEKSAYPYKKIRVWSAGCSTGEEPYTLAMILLEEQTKLLAGWSIEVQATDLNDRSLETAQQGLYGDYAVRSTPDYFKSKYLQAEGKQFRVREEVKNVIRFSRLNLQDESKLLFMKGLDIIFCCNVLIYFDGTSKARVIQHFYNNLLPGGYFFLGHSESLFRVNDLFRLVHFPSATAYWKPSRAALPGGKA